MAESFEATGCEVVALGWGEAALAEPAKRSYGLLFTDLKMPGVGGLELPARATI